MDSIVEKLLTAMIEGGPPAVIAVLLLVIVGLIFERKRLLAELIKKDEKIDKIIDDYYKGNMTLSDALNSLKMVLYEIKSKL